MEDYHCGHMQFRGNEEEKVHFARALAACIAIVLRAFLYLEADQLLTGVQLVRDQSTNLDRCRTPISCTSDL